MASLKVKIQNDTGLPDPQRYIAFFGDVNGKADSPSQQQLRSVVFFRTNPLSNGGVAEFRITPQLYGFSGSSSSRNLTSADIVSLGFSEEVRVGEYDGNGTELIVKPSGNNVQLTKSTGTKAGAGTFWFWNQSEIEYPNRFIVGLARNVNNDVKPVAAIPLVPGEKVVITPNLTLYIARSNDSDEDTVIDGNKAGMLKEKIDIEAGQTLVTVTNKMEGTKNVLKVT